MATDGRTTMPSARPATDARMRLPREPYPGLERHRTVIVHMQPQAVEPLVSEVQRHGLQRAAQVPPRSLGPAEGVNHAPPRAGPEVAQEPEQRPLAGGARAAPLAERLRHHLAGDRPRQLEIALMVGVAQRQRVHVVIHFQVVVADVIEVPA